MALHNEILVGRFNRALQKHLALKGGPPAPQLASEITPNFAFNQMGVDFRNLEGWNRFANSPAAIVATAGNNCECRISNDGGSNVIGVIEKLWIWTSLADELDLALENDTPLVSGHVPTLSINPSISLDGRVLGVGGGSIGGGVLQVGTSLLSNTSSRVIARFQLPANTGYEVIVHEDHQIPLLPKSFLQVQTSAVTNTMRVVVWWRERFLEDSERS